MEADDVYVLLNGKIKKLTEDVKEVGDWKPIRHQGTVQTADNLPADAKEGWMYNIATDSIYGAAGMNVVKTADGWDPMGPIINMAPYLTKKEAEELYKPKGEYLTATEADKKYQKAGNYLSGTDNTLSVSGKAADAAVVGEKLTSMSTAIESAKKNAENQARSIANIQSAIKELNKKMSIDTYDELAEALVSGKIEDYVNVGDELMANRIKTLSITSSNGNLSFEVSDEQKFIRKVGRIDDDTYVFEYRGNSWMYLEEAINTSDFGFAVKGTPSETDLIYVKMNYEQVSHTFVDFDPAGSNVTHPKDPDVKHFAIIEQTYVPDAFNYDYPESALCITPGYTLPKGKYYIYNTANATSDWWCNYKRLYYAFEILNDIVATEETGDIQLQYYSRGNRETAGDARGTYELTCKPYCCATKALYNADTVKFVGQVAQPGEEYTDIRTIENFTANQSMDSVGIIYNNLGHVCYGNNEWNVSNLRQRMNSSEKSMNPVRAHKNDMLNGM